MAVEDSAYKGTWWNPPTLTSDRIAAAGKPVRLAALSNAEHDCDSKESEMLEFYMCSARTRLPGGSEIVAFVDDALGESTDLWIMFIDSNGIASPVYFIGRLIQRSYDWNETPPRLSLHCEQNMLVLSWIGLPGGSWHSSRSSAHSSGRILVDDIMRDSDGDGLTDRVEKRIRTDPNREDTDGDGSIDSMDRTPNSKGEPRTEQEQIVFDIFKQYFAMNSKYPPPDRPLLFENPFGLEWEGRRGPTITLNVDKYRSDSDEAGRLGYIFTLSPWSPMYEDDAPMLVPLGEDERLYRLGDGFCCYEILVRRCRENWILKDIACCGCY